MLERKRFQFILEAREPIAHHAESLGNSAILMRDRVRQPDGSWANVPIVTGDTMRHGLREASTYALLECAGMLGEHLTEQALRLLFAGGMVTGSGPTVRLDEFAELVELVPPLALLGGCAQNRVIPGRMQVDSAILICEEGAHFLPTWVGEWLSENGQVADGARAHVEEVQRVRMDPMLDPGKRRLLLPEAQSVVSQRLLASEAASIEGDAFGADKNKSSMMPRRFERVARGSLFFWSLGASCYSALDVDTFLVMVGTFLANARVGGKGGTGHGLLAPVAAHEVEIARLEERSAVLDLAASAARTGDLFRAHVTARADRIREFLGKVAA